ncbi:MULTISPECIES: GNAT family N-acetyltransferase [unclassified Endozoicomonas]|uniref:GNAT family N-acetyltransferase n=1 Tax=unclassified Endozoicomonas TaxID=2644528 RepID=UPI0021482B2D|nr:MULTISPECIES: GNAT family N-acetyltransferase [unclassified Endozoicomonas]
MINWQWSRFEELTGQEVYSILEARQAVFIVEQDCPYPDADGLDQRSLHLSGWGADRNDLVAYLRIIPPSSPDSVVTIGRVITTSSYRGRGLGKEMMKRALEKANELFPEYDLYLSGQAHLQAFYGAFGFRAEGGIYVEDGIPHIAMFSRRS